MLATNALRCAKRTSAEIETSQPIETTLSPESIETTPSTLSPLHHEAVKTLLASELLGAEHVLVEHGDRDAAAIFQLHDRRMRQLLAQHGGLELEKSATLLLLFDRPLPAVLFALDYHDALRQLTDETGIDCRARLGIHLGEVVLRRNSPCDVARGARLLEVEGLAKMTAQRLLPLAGSGQTLLTRPAYEMAKRSSVGRSDVFEWVSRGRCRKGLAEPVELFEVRASNPADRLALVPIAATRTDRARPRNQPCPNSFSPGV